MSVSSSIILVGEYGVMAGGDALAIPGHHIDASVRELVLEQQKEQLACTQDSIRVVDFSPSMIPGDYWLFLLDSGERFETGSVLKHFQEEMSISGFSFSIRNEYLVINQKLIEVLLKEREADPAMLFRAISDFQFTHFRRMIPGNMTDSWLEGQISNEYYLKLSGSGGPIMIGITHETSKETLEQRWGEKLTWIE
ncbi:MAG: hypothetical protein GY790_12895 [Bacteroidetes bacterium]|nr:hypothetical protein [Bacteroidota bacterium]